ncbi:MAG TPA: DUF305 domain-containing protein [Mycobacteriales bacterium]|jgi:uncharacterized protein (DUF305 family)|nr:DUF305 domain-containing protein [Mycobacteriales bacterium]
MSWRDRLPKLIEVALALVVAFALGRLTVHTSSDPKPGGVDIGFSQDMAVHHEQAVLMAGLAQTRGGAAVTLLANAILIDQSQEIGLMRGWLKLWDQPTIDPHPMSWMTAAMPDMSMSDTSMPGMATPGQLTRLASLTGRRFDVLFLQLMIRHHEGGLLMCQYAQAHARLEVVRDAATSMAVEQVEDLAQMKALLKADGGQPLSQNF